MERRGSMYDPARDTFYETQQEGEEVKGDEKEKVNDEGKELNEGSQVPMSRSNLPKMKKRQLSSPSRSPQPMAPSQSPPRSAGRSPPRKLKRPTTRTVGDEGRQAHTLANPPPAPNDARYRSTQEVVRQHYNQKPEQGVYARAQSELYDLRKFNNFIKSILIQKFGLPEVCRRRELRRPRVLDLGCGKGGDVQKWDKLHPDLYIAVDIAPKSVAQARERYEGLQNRKRRQRRMQEMWAAKFVTLDAYSHPLVTMIPTELFPVDVVSMQFCMHYAFESEEKAKMMLSNVSKSLVSGGVFLGTIPSSDAILEHIERLGEGEKEFGNSAFTIRFSETPPRGAFRPIFGHRYTFFMKGAVEDVPEYVVPFEGFRGLADEYGLELLYRKGFHEIFESEVWTDEGRKNGFPRLGEDMKVINPATRERFIAGDQWEAVGLYLGFAFYKR